MPSADTKIVYRRYASLFFIAGCDSEDNELITLEVVHRYVEQMDKYYGNVCELDIIFNFQKAYFILDELLLAGEMQESSKKNVLRCISQQDSLEDMEVSCFLIAVHQGRHAPSATASRAIPAVASIIYALLMRQLTTTVNENYRSRTTASRRLDELPGGPLLLPCSDIRA